MKKVKSKKGKVVIANINIEIPTNAKTDEEAIEEAKNCELPDGEEKYRYVVDNYGL